MKKIAMKTQIWKKENLITWKRLPAEFLSSSAMEYHKSHKLQDKYKLSLCHLFFK